MSTIAIEIQIGMFEATLEIHRNGEIVMAELVYDEDEFPFDVDQLFASDRSKAALDATMTLRARIEAAAIAKFNRENDIDELFADQRDAAMADAHQADRGE